MTTALLVIGCFGLALVAAALLDELGWLTRARTTIVVRRFDGPDMHVTPTDLERRLRRR